MTTFTDTEIEQEIQAKGLTAPQVTLAAIEAAIAETRYFTAADGVRAATDGEILSADSPLLRLTFCLLVLANGFIVVGHSACVSPENFDADLGRKIARRRAIDQCWPLFGFHLAMEQAGM
jgi:hypothetical protein